MEIARTQKSFDGVSSHPCEDNSIDFAVLERRQTIATAYLQRGFGEIKLVVSLRQGDGTGVFVASDHGLRVSLGEQMQRKQAVVCADICDAPFRANPPTKRIKTWSQQRQRVVFSVGWQKSRCCGGHLCLGWVCCGGHLCLGWGCCGGHLCLGALVCVGVGVCWCVFGARCWGALVCSVRGSICGRGLLSDGDTFSVLAIVLVGRAFFVAFAKEQPSGGFEIFELLGDGLEEVVHGLAAQIHELTESAFEIGFKASDQAIRFDGQMKQDAAIGHPDGGCGGFVVEQREFAEGIAFGQRSEVNPPTIGGLRHHDSFAV